MDRTVPTEQDTGPRAAWSAELRDRICAAFENLEDELTGTHSDMPAGRFERKAWNRPDAGGTAAAASRRSCAAGCSRRSG